MKIAIIIYSESGRTQQAAELIGKGIEQVEGCEYRIMNVDPQAGKPVDNDYIHQADAVIFGTPTYYANICWQLKKFIDETDASFAGKLGAVFATANALGGGSETAMLTLINQILVKGMLVYSGGTSLGKPNTHLGVTSIKEVPMEQQEEKMVILGTRIAQKAKELFEK